MSSTDDLFDALERCAATSSKKEKLAIVKTLGEFKDWLKFALDPTVCFYVAKLDRPTRHGSDTLQDAERDLLRDLSERRLTGGEALVSIGFSMSELTPKSQEVLRRIILKDLRCGVGETIFNDAFPGELPYFPYMRCVLEKDSNMPKWHWADGIFVQLKADGMFANVNVSEESVVSIFSRQGSRFPAGGLGEVEVIMAHQLQPGTQTHGELTVYKDGELLERQIGNGVLNSVAQGGELPEGHEVRFDAWDQIPLACVVPKGRYEVPYADRLQALRDQLTGGEGIEHRLLRVIETAFVHSKADMLSICAGYQLKGLEGVIAKHPAAYWRDGDNKDQVKGKLEVDVDLKIVGFRPGEVGKRTEHTFGSVICQTSDGLLEVGVHGFKREVEADIHARRDELVAKGAIMTVRANGVMKPTGEEKIYSLFLPRFAELRTDKREADSLQRVIDQFDAAVKV